MPEALTDHFRMDTAFEHQRGTGMAQVMKVNVPDTGSSCHSFECVPEPIGVPNRAILACKDEVEIRIINAEF